MMYLTGSTFRTECNVKGRVVVFTNGLAGLLVTYKQAQLLSVVSVNEDHINSLQRYYDNTLMSGKRIVGMHEMPFLV